MTRIEHLSYLLLDGAQPVALFTGGALTVGGVARTDLADPARTDPGGLPVGAHPAWPARRSGGLPYARARVVLLAG